MIITGKELMEKDDLVQEITDGLKDVKWQNNKGRIHASMAGYCPRRGALEAVYSGDKVYEASSALYMGIGVTIEEKILDGLDKRKKLFFRQYVLPDIGINLGGRVDGIVLYNK